MRDRLLTLYGGIHAWLLTAVLYFALLSLSKAADAGQLLKALYFLLPVFGLYWNKEKGKHIWSYFFFTGVFLWGGWLVGSSLLEKAGLAVFTTMIAFGYFADRVRDVYGILCRPEYPFLGVFAAVYFYSLYLQRTLLEYTALCAAVLYWLLILWVGNRESVLWVCRENQKLHRFPQSAIMGNNRLLLGLITLATLAGMAFLPFSGLRQGIYGLGYLLRSFFSWLLRGLESDSTYEEQMMTQDAQNPFPKAEEGQMPAFLHALFQAVEKLLVAAVILAFLAGVVYFIIWLYRRYEAGRSENGDVLESIEAAGKEKRERLRPRRKVIGFFHKYSAKERIRRYYRQQILKYGKTKPSGTETPKELEEQAGLKPSAERERLHQIYEQARYSSVPCTRAQEQEMKQADRVDFSREIV